MVSMDHGEYAVDERNLNNSQICHLQENVGVIPARLIQNKL